MTISFPESPLPGNEVTSMTSLKRQSQSQGFSPLNFAEKALETRLIETSAVN